jgi:hypothetical protein
LLKTESCQNNLAQKRWITIVDCGRSIDRDIDRAIFFTAEWFGMGGVTWCDWRLRQHWQLLRGLRMRSRKMFRTSVPRMPLRA